MINIKNITSKNFKKIRKNLGYSQEEFAELIGLQRKSISHIETKYSTISCDTIEKICNVLKISPVEFFVSEIPLNANQKICQIIDFISKFDDEKLDYSYRIIKAISDKK